MNGKSDSDIQRDLDEYLRSGDVSLAEYLCGALTHSPRYEDAITARLNGNPAPSDAILLLDLLREVRTDRARDLIFEQITSGSDSKQWRAAVEALLFNDTAQARDRLRTWTSELDRADPRLGYIDEAFKDLDEFEQGSGGTS